jgi:hypothetical protein
MRGDCQREFAEAAAGDGIELLPQSIPWLSEPLQRHHAWRGSCVRGVGPLHLGLKRRHRGQHRLGYP